MARSNQPWWRLVRFGFRLLYNEFAFTYDMVSRVVSLGAWHCWQQAALKHLGAPAGSSVLEIAYGTGNLQLDFHTLGYRVFGHDLSPAMARLTSRKLKRIGLPVRLTRGYAQQLPYTSAAFDAVVSTFPAEFILAPETLREIYRVLKPACRLVIVPNGVLTGGDAVVAGIEWLYRLTGQRGGALEDGGIERYFAPYGFRAEVVQELCPRSVATVIVAIKTP